MKQILIILSIMLLLFFAFQCEEKKKPNNPDLEDPGYYFPINFEYKWTYVYLNLSCIAVEDGFAIAAVNKNTRPEGSGWDLVSSLGGTTFVYRKGDTIFTKEIDSTPLPSKVLVGPIQKGRYWKDLRGYEYYISGFEDIYSAAAGGTYYGCAKIERTSPGDPKKTYLWWAPQFGKVRREEKDQSDPDHCVSGEELRRLDKSPYFP